ncbi:DUF4118 domain-containing protein [Alkalibaculum sporogenes]|nr:DUF4118 domain-containing protein [Alkalibaculum sporogenes]
MSEQRVGNSQNYVFQFLLMALLITASSIVGYAFRFTGFPETNIVIIYLLAVLMTSWLIDGFIFGILASVIATFAFNFFFTEPYYTFTVYDPSYFITFIIMTITALITSTLTSHVKQSALSAKEREAETKAVYNLTNHLTDAKDIHEIAGTSVKALSDCFDCNAAILCFDSNGLPELSFIQQITPEKQVRRKVDDIVTLKHRIDGLRTGYDTGTEFYDWPIYGRENILGIIRIPKERAQAMTESQIKLLHSMIESTALAMDRFMASEQRLKEREEATQERYRGNLLRSISHDLRTPLSGIMGTTEMLMDMTESHDPRYSLLENIHNDANWLHSLVENILNLTRLQEGKLILNKQMETVEEVIGSAVNRISQRAPKHEITVSVPDKLFFVPMDAKLIEQVLINLLDNSIKHTIADAEISVSVKKEENTNSAVFVVKDKGTGISTEELPYIFEIFYTSRMKSPDVKSGIGLGLAICDTIIKAHGGTIKAMNRSKCPGTEIIFTLPLEVGNNE